MVKKVKIPGRVESAEVGGIVTGAGEILDDDKGKKQSVINSEVEAELVRLENEKQDNITVDSVPTEGSDNPVSSGAVYMADKALSDAIEAILLLIPSAASALNQLADKKFVQDSVATSTATFRGTYNVVSDLHLSANASHAQIEAVLDALSLGADTNDYCFVQVPDNESTENIKKTERYKFNGTTWAYEYDLNNSGFTAAQWEAINSNITALLVTKLSQLPTNEVLTALLAAKQNNLTFDDEPTAGSINPVTSGGIYARNNEIVAMITALEAAKQDSLTFDSVPVNGSENPVMSGGVYDAIYLVQVALAGLDGRMLSAEHSIELLTENVGILRTLYQALSQSDIIVGAKPATGVANVIYRVPGSSTFADWMYYNGAWVKLAEYTTLDGYLYKGIATPAGSPAASAVKMFYFALIDGTYTNFGNLVVTEGISILKYDGANWTQDKLYYGDGGVFDISKYNLTNGQPTPYPDLDAALGINGVNVPKPLRKGGMSVKFIQGTVQTSDNKYVQYRLMADSFTTDVTQWQGVDEELKIGSRNLVESGAVEIVTNRIELEGKSLLLKDLTLSNTTDFRIKVGGKYKTGNVITYNIDLVDAVLNECDFRVYQNGSQIKALISYSGSFNVTGNSDYIEIYLYRGRVSTSGTCNITLEKDDSLLNMIKNEATRAKVAFNDLDLSDSTATADQATQLDISLNKNDGTVEDPDIRNLTSITIPSASTEKAGLLPAKNTWDDKPTDESNNLISSGAVKKGNTIIQDYIGMPLVKSCIFSVSVDMRVRIYDEFVSGQQYKYEINLGDAVLNEVDFRVYQNGSQIAILTKTSGVLNINGSSDYIEFYLSWRRVTTGGNGTITLTTVDNLTTRLDGLNDNIKNIEDTLPVKSNYLSSCIDCNYSIDGYYINYSNGEPVENQNFKCTDHIKVISGEKLYYHVQFTGYAGIVFYDKKGIKVSSVKKEDGDEYGDLKSVVIPENAVTMRVSLFYTNQNIKDTQIFYNLPSALVESLTNTFCNYKGNEIGVFSRAVCIGDSLTIGVVNYNYHDGVAENGYTTRTRFSFPANLERMTGVECVNKGISGMTSFEWYDEEKNKDYSSYEFAIIQFGVNDAIRNMANYGTAWSEDSEQGFTNVINMLKTQNNNIKIFVSTVIPATSYQDVKYVQISQSIREFVAGLNDENVILLDMQVFGHTADESAYNCGHLSALGYYTLAKDYKAIISYYIHEHLEEFRQVQFIGSTYEYRT